MALALDVSAPALFTGTAVSITSASFTPPNGSLVVILYTVDAGAGSVDPSIGSVTNTGTAITWTRRARKNLNAGSTGGVGDTASGAEIWTGVGTGGAIVVTVNGVATTRDKACQIVVLTGADTVSLANVAAGFDGGSIVPSVTVTGCSVGSYVLAANSDMYAGAAGTVGTGQTMISEYVNASVMSSHFWRTTAARAASGSQVMDQTNPVQWWNEVALEVMVSSGAAVTALKQIVNVTRAARVRASIY